MLILIILVWNGVYWLEMWVQKVCLGLLLYFGLMWLVFLVLLLVWKFWLFDDDVVLLFQCLVKGCWNCVLISLVSVDEQVLLWVCQVWSQVSLVQVVLGQDFVILVRFRLMVLVRIVVSSRFLFLVRLFDFRCVKCWVKFVYLFIFSSSLVILMCGRIIVVWLISVCVVLGIVVLSGVIFRFDFVMMVFGSLLVSVMWLMVVSCVFSSVSWLCRYWLQLVVMVSGNLLVCLRLVNFVGGIRQFLKFLNWCDFCIQMLLECNVFFIFDSVYSLQQCWLMLVLVMISFCQCGLMNLVGVLVGILWVLLLFMLCSILMVLSMFFVVGVVCSLSMVRNFGVQWCSVVQFLLMWCRKLKFLGCVSFCVLVMFLVKVFQDMMVLMVVNGLWFVCLVLISVWLMWLNNCILVLIVLLDVWNCC